jgi:TolB-like protein/Flp pilus assembly protein TadD
LSQHSAVVGTVGYMAPEQLEGRAVDARSDIFAFGVVLYEVLTRRSPFAGNTDRDVIDAVVHQEPQPLPPDLPEALRTIVEKALEKDPADRYQSMRDLVVDLKRVARRTASAEVRAPADAARPPAAARSRRKWAVAATAAALAGFLVIGIALDFGDRAREADARAAMAGVPAAGDLSIIVLPFANQTGDSQKEYIADAVTSSITSALDYIDEADVVPIQTAYTYKEKTLTVQQIAQDAGVRFVLSGNVQAAGSQARIGVQLSGGAGAATIWNETITGDLNDIFALQDRVATLVAGSLGREMIVAADREQGKLAEDAETADLLLRAKALSWQSVTFDKHRQQEELFRTVLAREPDNRTALAGLAISIATRASWGFYEPKTIAKQGELFAEAEKLAERVDELSAGTEPLQDVRGWAAMFRGDFEMAERMFNALREQLPLNPDPYNALGVLAYMRYEPKQALELFKHADEVSAAAAPDFYFANSAIAYLELGDYEAVIDNVEKALTVNPQFHNVLPLAAVAYSLRGNDAAAASWAARARAANVTEPDVMGLAAGSAAYEAWANSVLRPTWRKLGLPE